MAAAADVADVFYQNKSLSVTEGRYSSIKLSRAIHDRREGMGNKCPLFRGGGGFVRRAPNGDIL